MNGNVNKRNMKGKQDIGEVLGIWLLSYKSINMLLILNVYIKKFK